MKFRSFLLIISCLYFFTQTSCKKDELLTDGSVNLSFSDDTLLFDTVFVTIGSITKNMRIYNTYDQPLKISNIRLAGGAQSNFRINVNGLPGTEFKDVEIRAGDSLWVFVEVTVDPNNSILPYILQDSIVFETNGKQQDVDLVAWGQNAHFIVANQTLITGNLGIRYALIDSNLNANITWDSILPYVIYGGYAVIDSSQTLTIDPGTQIHFSNNAGMWVYKSGTLKVQGNKDHPVVFQGLRREQFYQEEPGQWDRIWINDGGNNTINYAIIKNGFIGIQAETLFNPALPQNLTITNTFIRNMSGFGIFTRAFGTAGASPNGNGIVAGNLVVANCGQYCAALSLGGNYDFTHCTFANYWRNSQRGTPTLFINNYGVDQNSNVVPADLFKADFKNCIVYGSNENELEVEIKSTGLANFLFDHVLVKADNDHPTSGTNYVSVDRNLDPKFKDTSLNNYELENGSNAIDKGSPALIGIFTTDLKGNSRTVNTPDLGAYEK